MGNSYEIMLEALIKDQYLIQEEIDILVEKLSDRYIELQQNKIAIKEIKEILEQEGWYNWYKMVWY